MLRWAQTSFSPSALNDAMAVFRPDFYDAALDRSAPAGVFDGSGQIDAFTGPKFDPTNLKAYLAAFR
jgi:NitT/TauT family transport system ATP-binding protein